MPCPVAIADCIHVVGSATASFMELVLDAQENFINQTEDVLVRGSAAASFGHG